MKDKRDLYQIIISLWAFYTLFVLFYTLINTNVNQYIIFMFLFLSIAGLPLILLSKNTKKGWAIKSIGLIFVLIQGIMIVL